MFNVGPLELMVILIVALLVVGPSRLPEVGRSIGRGLREFRKAQDEVRATLETALAEEPPSRVSPAEPVAEGQTGGADGADGADGAEGSADTAPAATQPAEPTAGSDAGEVARTLGRGLAELRRAREEIQRTFRVDLGELTAPPPKPRGQTPPEPASPSAGRPEEPGSAE